MKNRHFFLMTLIISANLISLNGQMVVNDATANITLNSQLATASKQLVSMQQTYDAIKGASDKIEEVNDYVNSLTMAKSIYEHQKEIIENVNYINSKIKKIDNSDNITDKLSGVLTVLSDTMLELSKVTTNGFFNMTDKDRIDMIEKLQKKVFGLTLTTRKYAFPYRTDDSLREKLKNL